MGSLILGFQEIDKTDLMAVGGKGANLGELSKIEGINVPQGFCISTEAFKRIMGETPLINKLLEQLSLLKVDDREKIVELSAEIRKVIEETDIPQDIEDEITPHFSGVDEKNAYAVRSSATAEDLPTASFAGQQDTYLNIIGKEAILRHISKCWASLFTERAVTYRIQNGFDHRKVQLSVVVQKMIFPQVAGILFTADPVTSNRKVISIDASFGLGEALVSGIVNPDSYKVRGGKVIEKKITSKKLAVYALKGGGTKEQPLDAGQQNAQALSDEQILQLEHIGRKIEAHFGCPQDIEWCLAEDTFHIVQSRPITTLFPIPEAQDEENHIYLSVGHQQMMTDPIKPLGMSLFLKVSLGQRFIAAGRLFVDVAPMVVAPDSRKALLTAMEEHDPLMKDALEALLERDDFINLIPDNDIGTGTDADNSAAAWVFQAEMDNDPMIVSDLIKKKQASVEALKQAIQTKSGTDLIDFIIEDIEELRNILFDPESRPVYMSAMNAYTWINEKMSAWLGEKNAANILSQSVPNNITSEMGLELMAIADVIRPYPEVIAYLQQVKEGDFLEELPKLEGGQEIKTALEAYLAKYGMRCPGEIDITRTRWSEKPAILIPMILSNIRNFEPGAAKRKFEEGRKEAFEKEQELLDRLKQLPEGEGKAQETKRVISLMRNYIGFREYPKYGMVSRFLMYKQGLMKEAEQLLHAGAIHEKEDIHYLTLEEIREAILTHQVNYQIISKRKDEHKSYEKLTPPRVISSDGEIVSASYKRDNLPVGALVGLSVSSGIVEGRARVILNMEDANLEEGDILVTAFTDPSWTPLFVAVKALITEVGGLMTHGAVIAREYGLPAVIGVENATKLIKDGQRIRVNGTEGYIEIL